MFRIEFFVQDNRLSAALRSLAGIAIGDPKVQPVVNGVQRGGKVVAAGNGNTNELFIKYVKDHKLKEISSNEVRAFCKSIGRPETSYSYVLANLVKYRVVRKTGKGTLSRYTMVNK